MAASGTVTNVAPRTKVRLCGPLALEIDGRDAVADLPAGQARSLLAYLLTRGERSAERGALIDVVWPSGAPKDPQAHLRVILTRLRRVLAPATLEGRQQLRLGLPAPVWVDVEEAMHAIEIARAAARNAAWSSTLEHAEAGLALLRPGFLPGQEGEWAQDERREHEELELEALEWTARSALALGGAELATAQRAARELVSRSPFRETGHRLLMEALAATGNVAEALQVYDELRCLLRDELGVGPAAELQALHQRLLEGKPGAAPEVAERPVPQPSRAVARAGLAAAPTRYARNGEISLAYQVLGDGPTTLLLVTGWVLPMEAIWDDPAYARFVERLAASFRVILWDKRGTGLSDRVAVDRLPTLEERMDDIRAVLDAAGAERAAIAGMSEGSVLAALFGAAHPERTRALVLYGGWGCTVGDESYRGMPRRRRFDEFADDVQRSWDDMGSFLALWAPTHEHDPVVRDWWTRALHRGASPASAVAWLRMIAGFDIRGVVGAIHTPTLVLHRSGDRMIAVENGRWLAANIPGAEYVELPGDDHLWWLGDQDALLDELERFLVGAPPAREPDRVLATVLFTDIVGSTQRAGELGDRRWRDLMARHEAIVRDRLARFRGQEVKTLGDGFMSTFDGPARAIRCAAAIRDAVVPLGLELRAGLHTGEVEVVDGDVHGIAVAIAARVAATAAPGEVIVSRTVRDLVAGSGIEFEDRGSHDLKGVADDWHLYALNQAARSATSS
jgi:class 3 adenylate cyclase/DNA-binding SARP family transcriptional activator